MSTLMDRLRRHKTEAVHLTVAAPEVLMRGGMGEPYCSQKCYDEGGAAITQQMLRGVSDVRCHACEQTLAFRMGSPTSMVYIGGTPRYFHQTTACDGAVRAEVAGLTHCVMCGAAVPALEERRERFESTFGKELSDRLVRDLGAGRAFEVGETAVAKARERWSHRYEDDFLTPEQHTQRSHEAAEAGTVTLETRAAFLVSWDANLVAGDAAREAIAAAGLPQDDQELYLDFGASIFRALD